MREFVIHGRRSGGNPWLVVFVPGVALMCFGVLILIVPELLVAMVAAGFLGVGALIAAMGWRLRNLTPGNPPGGPFGMPRDH
jgi:hypothetical protein